MATTETPELGGTVFCPSVHDALARVVSSEWDAEIPDAGLHCYDAGAGVDGGCATYTAEWSLVLSCQSWQRCAYPSTADSCMHCADWGDNPGAL